MAAPTSRQLIYRVCWSFADHSGVIQESQQNVAEVLGMSYQQLSKIYMEFVDMGLFKKDRHRFTVLYNPNKIPWDGEYKRLREQYIHTFGGINETKSERSRRESIAHLS